MYTVQRNLYSSKTASEITSEIYYVGDLAEMTLFVSGSPSTTTIQGSNEEGRLAALTAAGWSTLTTVLAPGPDMVNIEPGFRWLRALRSETTTLSLAGRVDT